MDTNDQGEQQHKSLWPHKEVKSQFSPYTHRFPLRTSLLSQSRLDAVCLSVPEKLKPSLNSHEMWAPAEET